MTETINNLMDVIHIELVSELFPKSIYNRLRKAEVSTIGEFRGLDRDRYIGLQCTHPLNLSRFDELQELCRNNPGKIVHHLVSRFHDEETTIPMVSIGVENTSMNPALDRLDEVEIERISNLIPKSVHNRLKKLGISTIADVKILKRQEYLDLQCEHPLNIRKFDEFQDTCQRKPGVIMQQLAVNYEQVCNSNKNTIGQMRHLETGNLPNNTSLDQIELAEIKGIIPKSVYNRLLKLDVLTVGAFKNLDRSKYISLQCTHPLNISKFDELQHLLRGNPALGYKLRWYQIQFENKPRYGLCKTRL